MVDRLADVDQHQQFVDPSATFCDTEPVEPALQIEQFAAGLLGVERGVLQRDADAQTNHVGLVAHVEAGDGRRARRRQQQRRQHPHCGALPGTVGPEEAVDLAFGNIEIDSHPPPPCRRIDG